MESKDAESMDAESMDAEPMDAEPKNGGPKESDRKDEKHTFRIVTRGPNGELRTRDYVKPDALMKMHTQIGIDDCSTDLGLRGMPVFRGLIGPMPEGKGVVRYESPEVFETLTKEWSVAMPKRRSRSRTRS